jgi:predicted nucleic-acid-binding Zn-ribbon protein
MADMKETKRCPKCEGRKLWRIREFRQAGVSGGLAGAPIPIAITGRGSTIFSANNHIGSFDAYVCGHCGYSELWATGFQNLTVSVDEGVELVDCGAQDAPYR